MALNSLICAVMPLRNQSLTHFEQKLRTRFNPEDIDSLLWMATEHGCSGLWLHVSLPAGCRKWQTAGIKFTHRPKIRFFAPQGRLVAPIHVKFGRVDGHVGPLGCAKFHLNRHRGVGMQPQNIKNFHFLVELPRRGDSL